MKREELIKILKKYSQLMRVTKDGEARMGISENDYDSIADEIASDAKDEGGGMTDEEIEAWAIEHSASAGEAMNKIWGAKWMRDLIKERR